MQISTNQFYNTSNALMSQLTEHADKLQTQVSTGKRLQDPSDDAVAYQQLQLLARQTANDTAYQTNVSTAQSLLTQSDSTLSSVVSQIQRAQELAVQANSGVPCALVVFARPASEEMMPRSSVATDWR